MVKFPKFNSGQIIHKVGGRYGGPGRYVGETMELDDDGYRLHNVAHKIEGGYGEFIHVFPASALSDTPDTRATTPTASELVEALRPHVEKIANCTRINDEMGRVVTGQTDAARALKEIFDRFANIGKD